MPAQFIERPWGRLAFQSQGGGSCLLMLHTIGRNSADFSALTPYLSNRLRCISVDLCGHGQSDVPRQATTLRTMARDIIALIEGEYLGKCAIAGHGTGGMIALEVLRLRPDLLSKIVLLDTFIPVTLRHRFYGEDLIPLYNLPRLIEFRRTMARWAMAIREDLLIMINSYEAREIKQDSLREVLFVYGERDYERPSLEMLQIPRRDNFKIHWLKGAGHFFPLELPGQTAFVLQRYLLDNSTDFSPPPPEGPDENLPPPSLGELLLFR